MILPSQRYVSHLSDIDSGNGCWYVRTFGINRTDEFFVRLRPLRIVSPRFERAGLLRLCNNSHEGGGVFTCRKNLEPQHPGDTIHAVTQFPQRGKTPSQSGFNCVTNCVTIAYLCHRFPVTQFALNRFNCHRPPGSNCVTNCVTGSGDTIQG